MDAYQVCPHFLPFFCCCLYIQFSNLLSFNGFSMIFVRLSLVFLSTYNRLPFKRILDWDKFSLRIEKNDTNQLHNLVHRIKASDSFTLHSNLLKVKNIILTLIRLTFFCSPQKFFSLAWLCVPRINSDIVLINSIVLARPKLCHQRLHMYMVNAIFY